MKKFIVAFAVVSQISSAHAGSDIYAGKNIKETAAQQPCPSWYADTEWNVGMWGAYVFTGEDYRDDRYIEADHAWGGGIDVKYFFRRYFGVGIEGWAAEAIRQRFDGFIPSRPVRDVFSEDSRVIGSALGTLTLRYPFRCSRFSPYVWAAAGAIVGGAERDFAFEFFIPELTFVKAGHIGSETRAVGQFGGGLEVRFTPHIGWINDFSWNVIDGSNNNFGMVRSGINFAF